MQRKTSRKSLRDSGQDAKLIDPTRLPASPPSLLHYRTTRLVQIHAGPGSQHAVLRDLPAGSLVRVFSVASPYDLWIEIAPRQWIPVVMRGEVFAEEVTS
jgi:hypothetical protein